MKTVSLHVPDAEATLEPAPEGGVLVVVRMDGIAFQCRFASEPVEEIANTTIRRLTVKCAQAWLAKISTVYPSIEIAETGEPSSP